MAKLIAALAAPSDLGLEIFSEADIRIAEAERDTFILDRIEAGITLYRATRDAPLAARERGEERS